MSQSLKNIKIGKGNFISPKAIIHDNVIIGNNNKIYDDVILYPNVVIGNDNILFPRNIIGDIPINSHKNYNEYNFSFSKGVVIGDNNFFHVNNIICGGSVNKTLIGNNNKFLAENHIAHDVVIFDNVTFYMRVLTGGHSVFLSNSNIGMYSTIHQKRVIGQYCMIGANNTITKNVFPYYININNKLHRLNVSKIPNWISEYDSILKEINSNFLEKNYNLNKYNLPDELHETIHEYVKNIIII
jgi:UDP-N-acetylglucosamine acyltransferase